MANTFVVQDTDKGIFKPAGLFEFTFDERPNSLPPQIPLQNTTRKGEYIPQTQKITDEEIRALVKQAVNRGDAPRKRLEKLSLDATIKNAVDTERRKFFNLSLYDLAYNLSDRMNSIVDDLLTLDKQPNFLSIFTRGDRLVYIGLLMMIIAAGMAIVYIFGNGTINMRT